MKSFHQDLQFGCRSLPSNLVSPARDLHPCAGIGANTAILASSTGFAQTAAVFDRPAGDVGNAIRRKEWSRIVSPNFDDWQTQQNVFDLMAFGPATRSSILSGLTAAKDSRLVCFLQSVSRAGVQPVEGRLLAEEDSKEAAG
jgi:hypothetical protein